MGTRSKHTTKRCAGSASPPSGMVGGIPTLIPNTKTECTTLCRSNTSRHTVPESAAQEVIGRKIQKGVEHVERNRRRTPWVCHTAAASAPPAWDQARAISDRLVTASWSRSERFVDAGFVRRFSLTVPLLPLTLSRRTVRRIRHSAGSPHSACAPSKVKCTRLFI
jgi:hypothetical protein